MRMGSSYLGRCLLGRIPQMLELMPSCRTPGAGSKMRDISIPQSPSVTLRKQNYEEPVKAALYSG